MPEVLARITPPALDTPRGPDVVHRIRVPRAWLEAGAVIEFELPRNLSCASCDGGGCDSCDRSGAITLRGRNELPEILSVTLPVRKVGANAEARGVVIRIPEQGGLPPEATDSLPRGLLLLRIEPAEEADPGVSCVQPSAPPVSQRVPISMRIQQSPSAKAWLVVAVVIAVAAVFVGLAFWQHAR